MHITQASVTVSTGPLVTASDPADTDCGCRGRSTFGYISESLLKPMGARHVENSLTVRIQTVQLQSQPRSRAVPATSQCELSNSRQLMQVCPTIACKGRAWLVPSPTGCSCPFCLSSSHGCLHSHRAEGPKGHAFPSSVLKHCECEGTTQP